MIGREHTEAQRTRQRRQEVQGAGTESGELFVHHPYGFEGYLNEEGGWLDAAGQSNGWYRTGDLARTQPDGSIAILGRADASVNRSGYLVLLADIERVMEKIETLSEVVVVAGKSESKRGERIAAFCVPSAGGNHMESQMEAQIRARCFDLLPHYAIPDEVRVTGSLPLLPSGKVDRQALAALIDNN